MWCRSEYWWIDNMTPYGVILLLFGIVDLSIPNEVISQNIVELDPLAETTISSINSLPNLETNPNVSISSFNETLRRMKRHYHYNFFNGFINQRIYGNRIPQVWIYIFLLASNESFFCNDSLFILLTNENIASL